MSIIESIQKQKGLSPFLAGGMIVLAAIIMIWNSRSKIPGDVKKAFYSVDDGATYFVDDLNKAYPFDYNGKQAYRVYVFKSNKTGKQFVGYLERLTDGGRAKMAQLVTQPHQQAEPEISAVFSSSTEIKRPHESSWAPVNSSAYNAICSPTGPDGDKDLQCINP